MADSPHVEAPRPPAPAGTSTPWSSTPWSSTPWSSTARSGAARAADALAAPLFEVPRDRLAPRLHREVFGSLPSGTARLLDDAEVAEAVRTLLAHGWRPAQLAARVGALPAASDPVAAVVAFLQQLADRDSPQQAWDRERAERDRERRQQALASPAPASETSRAHWVAEARRSLGLPPRPRPAPAPRALPVCGGCGARGEFFVTRQVRLCSGCVALLASGSTPLATGVRAG